MDFEKLNQKYKKECREQTKRNFNNMINNFIDDDSIGKVHKDKILHMIVELLTLKLK